jgi:hypothetical protein
VFLRLTEGYILGLMLNEELGGTEVQRTQSSRAVKIKNQISKWKITNQNSKINLKTEKQQITQTTQIFFSFGR